MSQHVTLHSSRLYLRPFEPKDTAAFHQICRDAETMRFMPTPPHEQLAQTEFMLHQEQSRNGAIVWAICLKENDLLIGKVNYLGDTSIPGLGYILDKAYWGQGYATEACTVALEYGFETLHLPKVELWIDEENIASQRVAHKLGFALKSRLPLKYPHETNHHIMLVFGRQGASSAISTRFFGVEPILGTHDVIASVAYYRDKLGFRVNFLFGEPPEHAGLSRGEWSGSLASIQITSVPTHVPVAASISLYFNVDTQVDSLAEQFRERGVEIVNEPRTYLWGMREFTIRDCHGYLLRFGSQA